jgi:hypothetical protein
LTKQERLCILVSVQEETVLLTNPRSSTREKKPTMSTAIAFRTIFDPAAITRTNRPFAAGVLPVEPPAIISPITAATRVFVRDGHAKGVWLRDPAGVWTFADRPCRMMGGSIMEVWFKRGAVEILSAPQKGRDAINEAFEAGRQAAMADAAPVPPANYSNDLKGAWLDGWTDGRRVTRSWPRGRRIGWRRWPSGTRWSGRACGREAAANNSETTGRPGGLGGLKLRRENNRSNR